MPWTCEVLGFLLHGFRMEEGGSDGRVLEALEESHLEYEKRSEISGRQEGTEDMSAVALSMEGRKAYCL